MYDIQPNTAVDKLKGARNLRGLQRGIVVRLAAWRETEAQRSNRPRQWIVKDKPLLEIAVHQPQSSDELAAIPGMPERTARRAWPAISAALESATTDDNKYRPPTRPDESQRAQLKKMQKAVSDCAEDLGLASEIVAPKKDLFAALNGDRSGRLFSGWRGNIIGDQLQEILQD